MSYTAVEAALVAQLKTVSGLPALQEENTRYTANPKTAWCRATFLPAVAQSESLGVSGRKQIAGLFQVDLFFPTDVGTTAANAMTDAVVAAFSTTVNLSNSGVRVYLSNSQRRAATSYQNHYQIPVTVTWQAFVPK